MGLGAKVVVVCARRLGRQGMGGACLLYGQLGFDGCVCQFRFGWMCLCNVVSLKWVRVVVGVECRGALCSRLDWRGTPIAKELLMSPSRDMALMMLLMS